MDPHLAEDEELQKLKEWWKKNGTSIVVGVAVGLAAIVGVNGWDWYTTNRAQTASTLYAQLRQSVAQDDLSKAADLASELRADFSSTPYAASGALLAARSLYDNNDLDRARELLDWVVANSDDTNVVHTARIRLAYLELGAENPERALELVTVENPGAYASHYAEVRADAQRSIGDLAAARQSYDEAIAALTPGSDYGNVLAAKKNSIPGAE